MGGPPPDLTVLVVTWRRTQFLREAIESALHQSLDRSRYEVVLSKGVPDPSLEAFCKAQGVEVLFEETWDLGTRINLALDHCHGEVILILEDDDEFDPAKLAVVLEAFQSRPDLAYMHNHVSLIGPDGRALESIKFRQHTRKELAAAGSTYSAGGDPVRRLAKMERFDPSWNTSSVTFRRSLLDGHRETLGRLSFLADRWIYLCALVQGRGILLDERPLTRYRLHPANTSGVGGRRGGSGRVVGELVERIRSISDRQLADFLVIRDALVGASQFDLARTIEARLPLLEFLAALRAPRPSRRTILFRFLELVRAGRRPASASPWAGRTTSTMALYGLTPLFVLSPRLGAAAYVYLRELPRR